MIEVKTKITVTPQELAEAFASSNSGVQGIILNILAQALAKKGGLENEADLCDCADTLNSDGQDWILKLAERIKP